MCLLARPISSPICVEDPHDFVTLLMIPRTTARLRHNNGNCPPSVLRPQNHTVQMPCSLRRHSLAFVAPFIQTDTHSYNDGEIHPWCHCHSIRLLPTQQFPGVQELPINPRDHVSRCFICDISPAIEKVSLHEQPRLFGLPACLFKIAKHAVGFAASKRPLSLYLKDLLTF